MNETPVRNRPGADDGTVQFVAKLADLEFGYQDGSESGGDSNLQPHRVQEQQASVPPAIPDTVRAFSARAAFVSVNCASQLV